MNNKHLACAFLGLIIAAMVYGTMMFNNKVSAASEAMDIAERSYLNEVSAHDTQQPALASVEKKTAGDREYLRHWEKPLKLVKDAQIGESLMNLHIKAGNMVTLNSLWETQDYKKGGTIPRRLQGRLTFEDDYLKSLNWLAYLEGKMPASRISSCRLTKGQSGNDIKMELSIDIPMIDGGERKS
jgi:hypothetical protein